MKFRAIGIAGYMGAGKSAAARIAAELTGAQIVDADAEAKRMMEGDTLLVNHLVQEFGPNILASGRLSFPHLGSIVFRSVDDLRRLNRIVHPPLVDRLREIDKKFLGESYILDAALIPLWGIETWFDALIWIEADQRVRLDRLKSATGLPEARLRDRMRTQEQLLPAPAGPPWSTIANNGTVETLAQRLAAAL